MRNAMKFLRVCFEYFLLELVYVSLVFRYDSDLEFAYFIYCNYIFIFNYIVLHVINIISKYN